MKGFSLRGSDSLSRRPPVSAARRRLLISYAPDWIITIVLAAIFFSLDKVEGYRRVFSLEDTSYNGSYAVHERVPDVALYFICFVAPVLLQPVVNVLTVRSWWDLHNATLGLIFGLALTGSVTQFVKITVGRPRPGRTLDFLDRCKPPAGATDPEFGATSWTICTQTDNLIMRDGFRSFFSGHSSLSFAGLGFFSFYLAGKMHLFDKRGQTLKGWLALAPFSAASLVAISRTMDYRHHWQDVLVGAIVGTVFAFFSYRQYYPPLESEYSHRPYSPRIKREDEETLPTHVHNHSNSNYPFVGSSGQGQSLPQGRHDGGEEYELEGTVLRPHPAESLENMWRRDENAPPVQERSMNLEAKYGRPPAGSLSEIPALPNIRSESPRLQLPAHVYHGGDDLP
ncbi:Phosphatidate phosphatase PPAPDC1A [Leucoagaricus sp. SymC.cos]|nr:Phosphatidate phosphatase PPAPDC1A [Leucoagaricus sp. SymC.cos]